MTSIRRSPEEQRRRSDSGGYDYTERDDRLQLIVAQQTFLRLDHLADFADPLLLGLRCAFGIKPFAS